MSKSEFGVIISGEGELHDATIKHLEYAIGLLEEREEELHLPFERDGAVFLLSNSLPHLYDPENAKIFELFRRGCRAIINSFPEHRDYNKMQLFNSLTVSLLINNDLIDKDETLYFETIDFFVKLTDDEKLGLHSQSQLLTMIKNTGDSQVVNPEGSEN